MRIVDRFPHEVVEDRLRIRMSDGTHLAGRVWRPTTSATRPVPAVLEFIPYRQRDLTAVRDSMHHPYLAGHGFAGVRVDLRGSGDSEGVLTDEYLERELCDGAHRHNSMVSGGRGLWERSSSAPAAEQWTEGAPTSRAGAATR